MRKIFLLIIFNLVVSLLSAQTDFSKGYQKGYADGYCYQAKQNGEYNCYPHYSPYAPHPNSFEKYYSYKDGYQRGFNDGQAKYLIGKDSNNSGRKPRQYGTYEPPYDLGLVAMALAHKQAQYDKAINSLQIAIDEVVNVVNQVTYIKNGLTPQQQKDCDKFGYDLNNMGSFDPTISSNYNRVINWLNQWYNYFGSWLSPKPETYPPTRIIFTQPVQKSIGEYSHTNTGKIGFGISNNFGSTIGVNFSYALGKDENFRLELVPSFYYKIGKRPEWDNEQYYNKWTTNIDLKAMAWFIYFIAGVSYTNADYRPNSSKDISNATFLGGNFGAGFRIAFGKHIYSDLEYKSQFSKNTHALFTVGIGYKF